MASILIVDDSAVDRRMVGGLLSKGDAYALRYATDGNEALACMCQQSPDLVVTDLMMPGMDGLEFVRQVKDKYPIVPVILVTSQGSEETAVQALQVGAASYVPKRLLSSMLRETVERVLALSQHQRYQQRLMECMTHNRCAFILENDRQIISPLVGYLQDAMARMELCDASGKMRIGIALEEALVNALYHGNLEVSSELREENHDAYHALAEQRRHEDPYRQRRIFVSAEVSRQKAAVTIRDEGPGFDPTALPDPTDPANLEKVSGRGILLMRTFMDDVQFNDRGNEVTLTKRGADGTAPMGQ